MTKFEELLAWVRPQSMTKDERDEHRLSFAYGNLALTKEGASREAFHYLAIQKLGWSEVRFDVWASERTWGDR